MFSESLVFYLKALSLRRNAGQLQNADATDQWVQKSIDAHNKIVRETMVNLKEAERLLMTDLANTFLEFQLKTRPLE